MNTANSRESMPFWRVIAVTIVIADQITKWVAEATLNLGASIAVLPSFNFTLAYNRGAAWSFLSQAGGWQRWFFVVLSTLVSVLIYYWLKKLPKEERLTVVSLSLILGGAVGNLIDRVLYGHVIDFIHLYYKSFHWPVFNIADSAITIGAVLLAYGSLIGSKGDRG